MIPTRCKVEGMLISKFQFTSFLLALVLAQTAAAQAALGQVKSPHGIFDIPCGLQFLTSTRGFKGHSMGGSLAEALDAGVRLGAHWIEIYSLDGDNPANAKLLTDTAARLPGAAGQSSKGADR